MARRKKTNGIEVLLSSPWWISVGIAIFGWVFLAAIVPTILVGKPVFAAVIQLSRSIAWLPLPFFGFIAVISFLRSTRITPNVPRRSLAKPTFSSTGFNHPQNQLSPERDIYQEVTAKQASKTPLPNEWTIAALRSIEWKRFELLCAKYYEQVGFQSVTLDPGADGGVDIKLYKISPDTPIAIVQCKAWTAQVGVKEVRELFGVMHHQKVVRGIFITSSAYTKDAIAFGAENPIQLLDGEAFLRKILELSQSAQQSLLEFAFAGDYTTPTCASCGVKLIERRSNAGAFWGCSNFPRCRIRMKMKPAV